MIFKNAKNFSKKWPLFLSLPLIKYLILLKKLDIFIFKLYLGPLVLTFFIALFVLLMQFLWKYIDDFVGKGFELSVIAELMFYASATFVPMALPLAVLLSSLMLFGNLGENYELAAIKSAGISLNRIFRPLIFAVLITVGIAFYFSNNVLPIANLKFRSLLRDVRQQKPAVQIEAGIFYSEIDNYVIRIGEKNSDGVSIKDVMIYDHRQGNGNTNVTIAESGRMEMSSDKRFLVFSLKNGFNYDENIKNQKTSGGNTFPMQRTKFGEMVRRIDLSAFDFKKTDGTIFRNNYEMMNIRQLEYFKDSLTKDLDSSLIDYKIYISNDFSFLKLYDQIHSDSAKTNQEKKSNQKETDSLVKDPARDSLLNELKTKGLIGINNKVKITKEIKIDTVNQPSITKLDTNKKFNDSLLLNFVYGDALRISNEALSAARNASYHSEIVAQNKEAKEKVIAKHNIEWHRKFTLSLACLLFFFIGAPLGAIIRKGGLGMPLVLSIAFFVTYYVFAIVGEKSAKELAMSPFFGMWLSTLIYIPLSVFFTWKATADAPIFDKEFYIKTYNLLTSKLSRK